MHIKKLPPLLIFPEAERAASAMGRPSLRTPETVAKICAAIRESGHSDTHAAARAGISSSAISRWRQEDEDFAVQLDAARVDYLEARLQEIRETRKRDGSLDWRAQAWLLQVAAPEVYGTPSRRFSLAREKEEKQRAEEKARADDANVITPADFARCQQWRRYSIEKMNGVGEEEALWLGHFMHHPEPPVFPGSLAIAGAEIPPSPQLTPEEEAQEAALAERIRVARQANAEEDERNRREAAIAAGEEDAARSDEAVDARGGDVELGCAGVGFQKAAIVPESPAGPAGAARGGGSPVPRAGAREGTDLPERPAPVGGSEPVRRPLTGAARAAAEAKECRRIYALVEKQWERTVEREMAVAEAASRDAIPGMWAGL